MINGIINKKFILYMLSSLYENKIISINIKISYAYSKTYFIEHYNKKIIFLVY